MSSRRQSKCGGLDPYVFLAVVGKRIIHPGGRVSTERFLEWAGIGPGELVLDIGCGVARAVPFLGYIVVDAGKRATLPAEVRR